MGYDIYSLLPDRKAAEAHAKKYRSMWINEDGSYDEKAPDTLYFRLNIWGMPMLREFHDAIGFDEVNENLLDNSGEVIKDYECRTLSEKIAEMSDEEIIAEMSKIIKENVYSSDADRIDPSDEAKSWLGLIREWQAFLALCADLKGCEVL
jgi:hypothetical protein